MMKMLILSLCYLLSGITFTIAYPGKDYRDYRPRRAFPHQAMMFSGFYGRPNYTPEGSMTAFATKDTVATNTYAGNNYPFNQQPEEEQDESLNLQPTSNQSSVEEEEDEIELSTTPKPLKRKQKPARPQKPTSDEEEDEDDNSGNWPLQLGGRGYNAFFPIIFGGRGAGGANTRSNDYEAGYPGSATAIANSFSTGKGGVASSHATAYGDPFLSMLLRSGGNGGNGKKKNLAKNHD